jgi:hypothetical protein
LTAHELQVSTGNGFNRKLYLQYRHELSSTDLVESGRSGRDDASTPIMAKNNAPVPKVTFTPTPADIDEVVNTVIKLSARSARIPTNSFVSETELFTPVGSATTAPSSENGRNAKKDEAVKYPSGKYFVKHFLVAVLNMFVFRGSSYRNRPVLGCFSCVRAWSLACSVNRLPKSQT